MIDFQLRTVSESLMEVILTMLEWLEGFKEDLEGDWVGKLALGVVGNHVDYVYV
jgi:hypothetical protein